MGIGLFVGVAAIRSFQNDLLATFEELTGEMVEIVDMATESSMASVLRVAALPVAMVGTSGLAQPATRGGWFVVRVEAYLDLDEARAAAERLAQERG